MNDDDEAGRPSEGAASNNKRKSNGGCGGCLFPLILIALTIYCSFDKSDFYLMPGESNLWTDAMEEVFDNLDEVMPDSLELHDDLEVFNYSDNYVNKENLLYGVNPLVRVRSRENKDEHYLMRVLGIVLHTGPDEFHIRTMEMDTLINVKEYLRLKELGEDR